VEIDHASSSNVFVKYHVFFAYSFFYQHPGQFEPRKQKESHAINEQEKEGFSKQRRNVHTIICLSLYACLYHCGVSPLRSAVQFCLSMIYPHHLVFTHPAWTWSLFGIWDTF